MWYGNFALRTKLEPPFGHKLKGSFLRGVLGGCLTLENKGKGGEVGGVGWGLSGPVLRDTARLSQRYPPIARYGVFGVSTWPIGCDTPSPLF